MSSFSAAYRGHTVRHYTRASRGLVVVEPRMQIIGKLSFEREIKREIGSVSGRILDNPGDID